MERIRYHILIAISTLLGLTACGDFLEEYSQDTDYVRSWVDLDELLIGDCYIKPDYSNGFFYHPNYAQFLHLITDEVEENNSSYGDGGQDFDNHEAEYGYYTWQQRVGINETHTGFTTENETWKKLYKSINIANNVLYSASKLEQKTDADREGSARVTGEAYFIRAFFYFYLVNMYGQPYNPQTAATDLGVPIKTSAEVIDVKYSRNSVEEVYNQILSDLKAAEEKLTLVKTEKKSIYRADLTAVYLLTSRVYLYMQNWPKAAEYARMTIERHPQLQDLNSNTNRFMLASNPENIFSTGGDDVPVMLYHGYKGLRVSEQQYQLYSQRDLRLKQWLWKYGVFNGLTMRENTNKYNPAPQPSEAAFYWKNYSYGAQGRRAEVSSVFWMRSAEAYLNLAEAEAYQGNDQKAKTALQQLLANRYVTGAPEITADNAGEQLIKTIRLERRREFILQGQRWFDLRRYRVCQVQPEKKSITHDYTVFKERNSIAVSEVRRFVLTEDDSFWTLPIPHEVLDYNTGMQGNNNQWREYTIANN